MAEPYWNGGDVQLYVGDSREILPDLGITADLIVADPPYAETSLTWDRWPGNWPLLVREAARSMWCFGSMRMFLERGHEFTGAGWKLSQDVIWEKHNGSGFAADRFKRVHETVTHWYRGDWRDLHHEVPRVPHLGPDETRPTKRRSQPAHTGTVAARGWSDDGTRMARTVLRIRSAHHRAIHPTEKPVELLDLLIRYACPPGGMVVDPFAGSGSTLEAARLTGRKAIGIEAHEPYAEAAARRLAQAPLGAS
ncbi:DNA-methyltransferase [Actinomadura rugatobispora]|uniref:Methyltransferase n=1 Tax=Actinomadura rugatobispora TaxID=1994 RepID=A0ABW0ZNI1_9ACTN|nr:site-specific DNA-methyltransferase [Actinomadura rugatobispora]